MRHPRIVSAFILTTLALCAWPFSTFCAGWLGAMASGELLTANIGTCDSCSDCRGNAVEFVHDLHEATR